MRFSDGIGLKVVSTSTAETVGKVHAFVVDPATRSVKALQLKKSGDGDTLSWGDITGFGTEAVMIADPGRIAPAEEDVRALTGKEHDVVGKRVLSSGGEELGRVEDVEFDPASGAVTALVLGAGEVEGSRLVGVGDYAVIVTAR